MKLSKIAVAAFLASSLMACGEKTTETVATTSLVEGYQNKLDIYKPVTLSADLSHLSDNQKQMLSLLIDASKIMDDLFWLQAFGKNKDAFLAGISDPKVKAFAEINYGPWDRMDGDKPFLKGFDAKPLGAQFYPVDMTKAEFEQSEFADKKGLYSIVQRDGNGKLTTIAYSEIYSDEINRAAAILEKAASFADNKEFANYLTMRAQAMRSDDYHRHSWVSIVNVFKQLKPVDAGHADIANDRIWFGVF